MRHSQLDGHRVSRSLTSSGSSASSAAIAAVAFVAMPPDVGAFPCAPGVERRRHDCCRCDRPAGEIDIQQLYPRVGDARVPLRRRGRPVRQAK